MKIMSCNLCCWGDGVLCVENRMPRIIKVFRKYSPDIIGVQEATPQWMDYLSKELTDYDFFGYGRDENKTGEASAIFWKKDGFKAVKTNQFWLSETPDELSLGWDGACRRVCTEVILLHKGKEFAVFNTHLDHIGEKAQLMGAKLIDDKMSELKDKMPVILTGDFNVSYGSAAYNSITLNDARKVAEITEKGDTWHNYGEITEDENLPIDHCFVSDKVKVSEYKIIRDKVDGQYISDHYPVLVVSD